VNHYFIYLVLLLIFLFGCTESYVEESTFEIESVPDECSYNKYNCSDFNSQDDAQEIFELCAEDVHDLDRDWDGIACE